MPRPVVFISYSHDSDEHREKVLRLAERLRQDGLDARLDQYVNGTPKQGWPRWMLDQLDEAGFFLVVCTETYYRRFRGHEEPGKGVNWEGALITQEIYDARSQTVKFVPVMLSAGQKRFIPEPLRSHTHYELTSEEHYQTLYRFLRGRAGVKAHRLGKTKPVSKQTAQPLKFGPAPTPHPSPPAQPTIIGVPHRNPYFTGREELLSRLHQQLQAQGFSALAQAAIYGLGGIGKTQTAIEYAYRFKGHYRFVLWVVAESESAVRAAYLSIVRELGLAEAQADLETAVLAVKAWLSREDGWLLVFDNADDPALVRPYLPPTRTGGRILLTSRAKSFAKVGIREPFRVEILEPEYAVKFLIERTSIPDAQAAAALAAELGYLPLALEQAAAYIETVGGGFAEYLARYRRQGLTLLERGEPSTDYPNTVATTWTLNFDAVREASPASAELLAAAAFLVPDSIPIEIFTRGGSELGDLANELKDADEDPLVFWELLEPLERYSLVERLPDEAFKLHRLTQEVVKDSLGEEGRRAWAERIVRALDKAYPYIKFSNWGICEKLQPHVLQAADLVRRLMISGEPAGRLLSQAGYFAYIRGDLAGAKRLQEQSLEIRERVLGGEHPDTLTSRNNLAVTLGGLGNFDGARKLFEQNLGVQTHVLGGEHPDTLAARHNLAATLWELGDFDGARKLQEQNLETFERVLGGEHPDTLLSRNNLAEILRALGDLAGARKLHEQTLKIQERVLGGEHPNTLTSKTNLAKILRALGDLAGARKLLEQTLEIQERVLGGEHPHTLLSRNNLAETLRALGDLSGARKLLEQTLEIQERVLGGEHPDTLLSRNNLAETHRALGDLAGARKLHEQTLEIQERVLGGEHSDTTISVWNLLQTVRLLNDYDAEAQLIDKLSWLLDRGEASIPSAAQRSVRQRLLDFLKPS